MNSGGMEMMELEKSKRGWGVVFILLGLFTMVPLQAQKQAKELFVHIPDSMCPILTSVNRADCIDFIESKMKAKVENRFGRESEMTALTNDYIRMQMSSQSSWQMKLLATSESTQVICTVSTACAPACDSSIQFYTTDWKELPLNDFLSTLPTMDDFLETSDSAFSYKYNDARMKADMLLMKADLSEKDNSLTFTFMTPEYMDQETAKELTPFIRRPIVYIWKNEKFVKE